MYSLTYCLLCCIFLTSSIIYTANLFAGEVVDLGSYKTSIAIGKDPIPKRYRPLTEYDKKAIYNAHVLINKVRSNFSTGVPPLPALDPYVGKNFPAIDLDGSGLPFSGTVVIIRIRLTGVKHFCLNNIEIRMDNLRTDFDLTVPQLNANVTFEATMRLGFVPVSAKAKVRITITGITVRGIVWATETHNFYSIEGLRVGFHANDIQIRLLKTNLKKYQLHILSSTSPASKTELTNMIEAVKHTVARQVIKQINNVLKKVTVEQVKNYLLAK